MARGEYRLYVDEVGNHDLKSVRATENRFLSLTGVCMSLRTAADVKDQLDAIKKRHLNQDPDHPIVLHRKEIMSRKYPFHALRDDAVQEAFNKDILNLFKTTRYAVVTVVIDKYEHFRKYQEWCAHPYHYCMDALLERYHMWLHGKGATGDVIGEARGGKEDRLLLEAFKRTINRGTTPVQAKDFARTMASDELKLCTKKQNIAGLQMADLLAYPSQREMVAARILAPPPEKFTAEMISILQGKYRRSPDGKRIDGFGRKWLP